MAIRHGQTPIQAAPHRASGQSLRPRCQRQPFLAGATTVDIGILGMRLRGVRCFRGQGDEVEVQYRSRRARYRIAWIGQPGTCWEGLAGLQGLEGAKTLFADHLAPAMQLGPDSGLDPYVPPDPAAPVPDRAERERREAERRQQHRLQQERRRYTRLACAGEARVWEDGNEYAVPGRINEISQGGCYIEMMSPVRTGNRIRLEMDINRRTIRVDGIIRTSQPSCGMGVEFTRVGPTELEKLHRVIAEVSGDTSVAAEPAEPPAPSAVTGVPPETAPGDLGEAVLRWFGAHDALTREEFLRILHSLKRAGSECAHA